jgi:hypothetical protein
LIWIAAEGEAIASIADSPLLEVTLTCLDTGCTQVREAAAEVIRNNCHDGMCCTCLSWQVLLINANDAWWVRLVASSSSAIKLDTKCGIVQKLLYAKHCKHGIAIDGSCVGTLYEARNRLGVVQSSA